MRDAGEVMFYRRSGTMDFSCATCHTQDGKRIRASVLPNVYVPEEWTKAISWPAHRTSHEHVRSSQHRVLECLWQMRYPNIKNGSDASIAFLFTRPQGVVPALGGGVDTGLWFPRAPARWGQCSGGGASPRMGLKNPI